MRGRRPIPTYLKLLRGNPGHQRLNENEPQPQPVETPDAPDYLSGHALDEWNRVAPGLCVMGLLTILDVHVLAAYCVSYCRWREAEELLAEFRARDPTTKGLLVRSRSGDARINPLVKVSRLMAADTLRYGSEFGFTPAARTRISVGPSAVPASPFDGLIG
jgi:P27 family predicted phage terminase small subunit